MTGPRILTCDLESMPAVVETWGLWDQNIPIQRIREPGYVFGLGYKWHDGRSAGWIDTSGDLPGTAWLLLDQADIVITYNGDKFDLPKLNQVMLSAGLSPPSPYKSVDLYKTAKRFGLESAKLDYVAQYFGVGAKIHTDYSLWQGCMAGDPRSIAKMARYCKGDVIVTEKLHDVLLPWIKNYPNVALWNEDAYACPRCGSMDTHRRGTAVALSLRYQRRQCQACGGWSRERIGERPVSELRTL